jgi:hypothetical protein
VSVCVWMLCASMHLVLVAHMRSVKQGKRGARGCLPAQAIFSLLEQSMQKRNVHLKTASSTHSSCCIVIETAILKFSSS